MKKTYIILSLLIFLASLTQAKAQQTSTGAVYNFSFNNGNTATTAPTTTALSEEKASELLPKKEKERSSLVYTNSIIGISESIILDSESSENNFSPFIAFEKSYSLGYKLPIGNGFSITPALMRKKMSTSDLWESYEGSTFGPSISLTHQGKADFLGFMGLQGGINVNYAKATLRKVNDTSFEDRNSPANIDNAESLNITGNFGLRMEFGKLAIVPSIHFGKAYHKLEYTDGHQKSDSNINGGQINVEWQL